MGLFDKKQSISRNEFRSVLRRSSALSRKVGGYSQKERVGFEKEIFGSKYGSQISKKDYKTALEKMRRSRFKMKNRSERLETERKINFLKKLGGLH